MSSLFSKAMVYLGLVDEHEMGEEELEPPAPISLEDQRKVRPLTPPAEGRRVEPPATSSRMAAAGGYESISGVRTIRPDAQANILVVEEFGDARILADWVRDRVPVVLDLRRTGHELGRRVIDFSSGLIYALDGRMRKVGDALVLVTPAGMELSPEEKRRLASLGAYELDD